MTKKLTPMMKQYMEIKENTEDALVFFRLGDFYELFFEDAQIASRVLDLVLTARASGQKEKVPMCGVPHHAAKSYIQKLVANGYKVAIVEQVEDPKDAVGIVKREVVEVVTPGTYFEMDDNQTREIASLKTDLVYASIVSCDVMTGKLRGIRVLNENAEIIKNLQQFQVKEIVVDSKVDESLIQLISENTNIYISYHETNQEDKYSDDYSFNLAVNLLVSYLKSTQKNALRHLSPIEILNDKSYLKMDYTSMTNLELIDHEKNKELSVYHFMNNTKTAMGSRLLKEIIMRPLVDIQQIEKRHEQIETFMNDPILSERIAELLKETYDIHRIIARINTNKHNAQDFVRLKQTLDVFHTLQKELARYPQFTMLCKVESLQTLKNVLDKTFRDDAPVQFKEGRTFHEGVSMELDELMALSDNGQKWLLDYERQERERTGIKNLKVSYTRAFGYYIEISKGQIEFVKDEYNYIRKQTLTNSERYISEPLQEYEVKISSAKDKIAVLEQKLFSDFTKQVVDYGHEIHQIGQAISYLDVMLCLSIFSNRPGYVKPQLDLSSNLLIKEGRHPVLESTLKDHQYISSDVKIDEARQILVLTGPNMGGKSTYMRMVAVNAILAQIGCYIPAKEAQIGIIDQIFTRMGASDDILMGQSTFMVEMLESQIALSRATTKSLILFDEIGRGTSTYDGMALAQSIIEYIHDRIKSRTIFSTHYHELVELETLYDKIHNVQAEVHEENKKITFMYKVVDGHATKSYGINVAKLADLPQVVIDRAQENLEFLEHNRDKKQIGRGFITKEVIPQEYERLIATLNKVEPDKMTPIEALIFLQQLKDNLKEG